MNQKDNAGQCRTTLAGTLEPCQNLTTPRPLLHHGGHLFRRQSPGAQPFISLLLPKSAPTRSVSTPAPGMVSGTTILTAPPVTSCGSFMICPFRYISDVIHYSGGWRVCNETQTIGE